MYLAYFDDSGDSGPVPKSPTRFFVLACVLVHESAWLANLDALIGLRSHLRRTLGISRNVEIKAAHIKKGRGPLAGLNLAPAYRAKMFRTLLRFEDQKLQLRSFAVAIDKAKLTSKRDPREFAWQFALERVDTFCRKDGALASIYPDAGHSYFIRRLLRRIRRHHRIKGAFGGTLAVDARRIVEDPNERASHDSYFIQLADWNAYAAHRSSYVHPTAVGYAEAWDALGGSLVLDVNAVRGGPPGIKLFP